jgi:ribonucleoside-diphosphate reductase beta chain
MRGVGQSIFEPRLEVKPYEYPELIKYVDAIRHSYWIHTEFNYTGDVHDFYSNVTPEEREVISNAMLAIAQVEVAIKNFWGDVYKKFPKPEIGFVGSTFAENEVRHMDAYAHLLEILGLNEKFKTVNEIGPLRERLTYLNEVLSKYKEGNKEAALEGLFLFSLFIEHISLFSQFLVMMSFNKNKNLFKGISNAVEATSKEENLHGMFGVDLIKIAQKEHPELFTKEWEDSVYSFCKQAYEKEEAIIEWMYGGQEPDFLTKADLKEFTKNRINSTLKSVGLSPIFEVNENLLKNTEWFDNEVIATKHVDFFDKRSINYNKRSASITGGDLF